MDSDYAEAYNTRGFALTGLGKMEEALRDFDKAISLKPDFDSAYANRAFTNMVLGNDSAAMEDAEKAIRMGLDSETIMEELESIKQARQP